MAIKYYLTRLDEVEAYFGGTLPVRNPNTFSGRTIVNRGGNSETAIYNGNPTPSVLDNYHVMLEKTAGEAAADLDQDYDSTSLLPFGGADGQTVLSMWVGPEFLAAGTLGGIGTLSFSFYIRGATPFNAVLSVSIQVWRPSTGASVGTVYTIDQIAGANPPLTVGISDGVASGDFVDVSFGFTGSPIAYEAGDRVIMEVACLVSGADVVADTGDPGVIDIEDIQTITWSYRHAAGDWNTDSGELDLGTDFVPYLELEEAELAPDSDDEDFVSPTTTWEISGMVLRTRPITRRPT